MSIELTEEYMQDFSFGKETYKSIDFWQKRGVKLSSLKQIKELKTRGFMSFDTETKDGLKGNKLFCYSLSYFESGKKLPSHFAKIVKNNLDLDELFVLIKNNDSHHKRIIYCHNLSFDVRFIQNYCMIHEIGCNVLQSGSSVIGLTIPSLNVIFRDSFQFLQSSQAIAEQDYLDDKLSIKELGNKTLYEFYHKIDTNYIFRKDYQLWSKKEKRLVFKHNKFDTDALLLVMKAFREMMFSIAKIDVLVYHSLASLAMKIFRTTILKDKAIENPFVYQKWSKETNRPRYFYDKDRENFVRSSYFGGRTEVFNMNEVENAIYIDRVSMYPSEMFFNFFPVGIPIWINTNNFLLRKNKKKLMEIIKEEPELIIEKIPEEFQKFFGKEVIRKKYKYEGFIKAKIKPNKDMKYPILAQKIDNKLMFTNCERIGIYTLPELRYAYKCNYEIEPIKALLFNKSELIFSEFVKDLFIVKSTSKQGKRKCAKIVLNSCYGKFGQAFERNALIPSFFKTENDAFDYYAEKTKFLDKEELRNFQLVHDSNTNMYIVNEKVESLSVKPFMNVALASYITAYSRLSLTKKIHELEKLGIEVYYSDTDSITIENKNLDKIQLGKELGGWDIEQSFDKVKFLAPKSYYGFKHGKPFLKMKGLDKDAYNDVLRENCNTIDMKTLFSENSQIETLDMKTIEERLRKPIQLCEKYLTYREALRHGKFLGTKIRAKHYSYENWKRNFQNGLSIAWNDKTIPKKFKIKV